MPITNNFRVSWFPDHHIFIFPHLQYQISKKELWMKKWMSSRIKAVWIISKLPHSQISKFSHLKQYRTRNKEFWMQKWKSIKLHVHFQIGSLSNFQISKFSHLHILNIEQGILNEEVVATKAQRHEHSQIGSFSNFQILTSKQYRTRNKEFWMQK